MNEQRDERPVRSFKTVIAGVSVFVAAFAIFLIWAVPQMASNSTAFNIPLRAFGVWNTLVFIVYTQLGFAILAKTKNQKVFSRSRNLAIVNFLLTLEETVLFGGGFILNWIVVGSNLLMIFAVQSIKADYMDEIRREESIKNIREKAAKNIPIETSGAFEKSFNIVSVVE